MTGWPGRVRRVGRPGARVADARGPGGGHRGGLLPVCLCRLV